MNGEYSIGTSKLKTWYQARRPPRTPSILVIEILITMVCQSKNIVGININGHEFKQCVYADDTTYFLHDLDTLSKLKKTRLVNCHKSEITWIQKNSKLPELDIETLDLSKDTIRILGVHFTYNKTLNTLTAEVNRRVCHPLPVEILSCLPTTTSMAMA